MSACTAGLACPAPATHYVSWFEVLTWNLSAKTRRPAKRRQRVELVCAAHAAVIREHVHDGGAARHGHTPVVVSGPYDPPSLVRKADYETTGRWR